MGQQDTSHTANSSTDAFSTLAGTIKPRTFQLGTAGWIHFLQAKHAKDETLSAVEMATLMSRW